MTQDITSFDATRPGRFGDILNVERRADTTVKVGLLAVGYFEYWRMYPTLRATEGADLAGVHDRLAARVDVVYPGMVDSMDRAEEAGRAFAEALARCIEENTDVTIRKTLKPQLIVRDSTSRGRRMRGTAPRRGSGS